MARLLDSAIANSVHAEVKSPPSSIENGDATQFLMRYLAFGALIICTMFSSTNLSAQIIVEDIIFLTGGSETGDDKARSVLVLEDRSATPSEVTSGKITQTVPLLGSGAFIVVVTPSKQKVVPTFLGTSVTITINQNEQGAYQFYFIDDQSLKVAQVNL